jgi:hypothetical protein
VCANEQDGNVIAFGDWQIHATSILQKHRKRRAQVLLLFPPPGFTGKVRLGVISAERRDEFTAEWEDGQSVAAHPDLAACLARLFADEAQGWPLIFSADLGREKFGPTAQANLLLEIVSGTAPKAVPHKPASGPITFRTAAAEATLYLAPMLPLQPKASPTEARELLDAALHAAEHDRALRLALSETWAQPADANRLQHLAADGRLEVLATAEGEAETTGRLDLPFPVRAGICSRGAPPARERAVGLRGLIVLPDSPDDSIALPGNPFPGAPGRITLEDTQLLLYVLTAQPPPCPLGEKLLPYTVALIDRVAASARAQAAREMPGAKKPVAVPVEFAPRMSPQMQEPQVRGFLPLFLSQPEDWKQLGGWLRHWNRTYASPQLVCATPSDYFSLIEEMHARGYAHLPRM